jgi:hypothetical protein
MNSFIHARFLATVALAVGALGAASAANAGSDVYFSIGLQGPVYSEPAAIYVQPPSVYVQPVYGEPQSAYVQPQPDYSQGPVYVQSQQTYRYSNDHRREREEERARRYEEWRRDQWRQHHQHGWNNRHRDDDVHLGLSTGRLAQGQGLSPIQSTHFDRSHFSLRV